MNYFKTFKKYWYIPVALVIATTVLSLVVSFLQTPKYQSTVKLLVIQRQGAGLDAYSAARSAETIAGVLSRMVYTTSFFDQVLESEFKLENVFSKEPTRQKQEWEDMVAVKAPSDGALEIDVYHPNRELAEGYAFGIAYVLVNQGKEYHGGGNQIEIKMVDEPFTSELPTSPNVLQNTALGVVSGLILAISILLFLVFKEEGDELALETQALKAAPAQEDDTLSATIAVEGNTSSEEDVDVAFSEPENLAQEDKAHPQEFRGFAEQSQAPYNGNVQ